MKVTPVRALIALAAIAALAAAWYLGSPLFLNQQVDEALPAVGDQANPTAVDSAPTAASTDQPAAIGTAVPMAASDDLELIASGEFVDADAFHLGSGSARLYRQPDGSQFLRFENFMVTNGPDLHVFLAEGSQPTDQASLGAYLDLGVLKGNVGNQNYEIEAETDLSAYSSVVIYCLPFHVVFSTATLTQ